MFIQTRFFAAVLLGLALAAAAYFGVLYWQLGAPCKDSYWSYEINRRKLERAEQIRAPKLLVVGGSSTLFGISARQLERDLGIPTVNMGTHAALGPSYMVRLVRRVARPGDTVLLALEYDLYERGDDNRMAWAGENFTSYIMARDPEYFRQLPLRDQLQLGMGISYKRLWAGVRSRCSPEPPPTYRPDDLYDPAAVDDYGDMTGHGKNLKVDPNPKNFIPPNILVRGLTREAGGFAVLTKFCAWAITNNVRVLATYPSICKIPQFDDPCARQAISTIQSFFDSVKVPNLGYAREGMLPRTNFLDTAYHLNQEAARARTALLAEQLKQYLSPAAEQAAAD